VKIALLGLAISGMLVAAFLHSGAHLPLLNQAANVQEPKEETSSSAPSPDPDRNVTVVGTLAQWMGNQQPATTSDVRRAGKPHPSDKIAPSPVGTSSVIVRKAFALSNSAIFPFELPAHAVNATLHGNYKSFIGQQRIQGSEDGANVSFLLMNEEQYAVFLSGRSADVLMSLDPSHDQDVNFGLPATRNLPVKYYLVFENDSHQGKKIVQANFMVDF
jgi:hypothetical protein